MAPARAPWVDIGVETGFSSEELRRVLASYDLGVVRSIRPLSQGSALAPKVVIECDLGRVLLKRRSPGRDDPRRVALLHQAQLALEASGVRVGELLGTIENNSMLQVGGHVYEVTRFIEGRPYARNADDAHAGGALLRALHDALRSVGLGGEGFEEGSYHRNERVEARLEHIAGEGGGMGASGPIARSLLERYRLAAIRADAGGVAREARRLAHGDWHPGNVVFASDGTPAAVDLDTLRIAPLSTDVASGALMFSIPGASAGALPGHLETELVRAFVRGYARDQAPIPGNVLGPLMVEALIGEAAAPLARAGHLGGVAGETLLERLDRLSAWIESQNWDESGA